MIAGCSSHESEGVESGDVGIYLAGVFTYNRQLEESRVDASIEQIGRDEQNIFCYRLITFSRPYSDVEWGPQTVNGHCAQFARVGPGAGDLSMMGVPGKLRDQLQAEGAWPQYAD